MNSWSDTWRRRGELLITVGLASGAVWLSILPTQHLAIGSIWPALAVSIALVVIGGYLHVAPDYERLPLPGRQEAVRQGRRHSPAFREHVEDLHQFANRCHDSLYVQVQGNPPLLTVKSISFARPTGHSLRAHFPDVGTEVDRWNEFVDRYDKAMDRWRQHQISEGERLFPDGRWDQGLTGLMSSIANGETSPSALTWSVQNQRITATVTGGSNWWGVGIVPNTVDAEQGVRKELKAMVSTLYETEVARNWREAQAELNQRRTAVLDALEGAALVRDPPGTCKGCPH